MTGTLDIGWLPHEAHEIDRWLREGKAELGWRGDPRLYLVIGVVTAGKSGYSEKVRRYVQKGDRLAWSWQVWRHNEDGTDKKILQRKGDAIHELIPALIDIDPRTPGFIDVMDRVIKEDNAVHLEKQNAIKEAQAEHADHLWNLVADRQNGKTTFRGLPGRNPDRQM